MRDMRQQLVMVASVLLVLVVACSAETESEPGDLGSVGFVNEIADKYGASTEWWDEEFIYSIHAQVLLIGQPVAFPAYVDDVFFRNEQIIVRFGMATGSINLMFELECDPSTLAPILNNTTDKFSSYFNEYVVVAEIEQASKAVISIVAEPIAEYEAEINWGRPWIVTATGTCIEVVGIEP